MSGKLLILSAPSGAGKTSLLYALLEATENTKRSISHTTRSCRKREQDGVDYFFVDVAEFERMIAAEGFLEYAKVYDNYYGTSKKMVTDLFKNGQNVLLDIDWQGARQVKELMSESISVSILPPSLKELERRLVDRGRDEPEVIAKRMLQAESEISHCHEADYIVMNDDFELALQDLKYILAGEAEKIRELTIDIDSLLTRK
jgi:guanylate kinase